MSSNFSIDIEKRKHPNPIDMYIDIIKENLKKKKINESTKNIIKHTDPKTFNDFQDQQKNIDLENAYKNSIIILDIIQKNIEKNILRKYNIEKNIDQNIENNKIFENVLMKKKFLNNLL